MLSLASRFGVETFDSGGEGRFVAHLDGATHSFPIGSTRGAKLLTAPIPRLIIRAALALLARRTELPLPASRSRRPAPRAAASGRSRRHCAEGRTVVGARALELDHQTIGAWIDDMMPTRRGRLLLEPLFGYFPRTTSLLFVLHFLNTWGWYRLTVVEHESDGVLRFTSGAQSLSLSLADALGHQGDPGQSVTAIEHTADGVRSTPAPRRSRPSARSWPSVRPRAVPSSFVPACRRPQRVCTRPGIRCTGARSTPSTNGPSGATRGSPAQR